MAGGLTTDQLLAEFYMQPAPNKPTRALAHQFVVSTINELPPCDRTHLGEVLLRVSSDVDGFMRIFMGQGMSPDKAMDVIIRMLAAAGVELYTEGMSAEEVTARVAAAVQEAL
jgi:hypothetical protein